MTFGPLVGADWLAQHADTVAIVDTRWNLQGPPGRDEYDSGHIPGAVYLDMDQDLAAPATEQDGRHPLPTPQHFAEALGRAGIGDGRPVVVYDAGPGAQAARLWWLLHVLDEPVAVLDGGIAAWQARGGALSTGKPTTQPAQRTPKPWPAHRFVDADQIAAAVANRSAVVYDARTPDRYGSGGTPSSEGVAAGGGGAIDPRPGHIPGALNAPWPDNVDEDGRFRAPATLRENFPQAQGNRVIAYCGSGVTACHDLLALELAGHTDTALYPGSWSQWGADPTRPAEGPAEQSAE